MSTAINSTTGTTATTSSPASATTGTTVAQTTKDEFMKLFIAQLQHQDPLSPQDSSAFLAQLAQLSQLEQSTQMNDKLQSLADAQAASARASLSDMVGRTVTARVDSFEVRANATLSATSAPKVSVHTDLAATNLKLNVLDSAGNLKKTIDLGPHAAGDTSVDVTQLSGLAAGSYKLQVVGKTADSTEISGSTEIAGVVDALQMGDTGGRFRIGPFNVTPASITSVGASAPGA
jgi:flagellar basal-body rod modification protein FlgD